MPGTVCTSMHISPPSATQVKDKLHNIPRTSRSEFLATRPGRFFEWQAPTDIPDEVPAQILGPKWSLSSHCRNPVQVPSSGDISMHKFPAHSWRVPRYCMGTLGSGIHMIYRCISWYGIHGVPGWVNASPGLCCSSIILDCVWKLKVDVTRKPNYSAHDTKMK